MVRKGKQLQVRLERVELANKLLEWLTHLPLLDKGEGAEGSHTYERVIIPFSHAESVDTFKAWRAWDILLEAGRRKARPGNAFEVVSFKPIEANNNGEVK